MPHMDNLTKIHVCWNLYREGISPEKIPKRIGIHRATVYRWIRGIQLKGIRGFLKDYKSAKKGRRQRKIDPVLKARIYRIREEKRDCCGQKIKYYLKRDYGQSVSVSTIYRILNLKYQLREKRHKNTKRGPVLRGEQPREAIQVATVDFGEVYAFTAIDTYTREASVILKTELNAKSGEEALVEQLKFFGEMKGIQRDGGPEFMAEWEQLAKSFTDRIRTSRPYKKNDQAFIERFNGVLRKECLGWSKYRPKDIPLLQKELDEFLEYYHYDRPHMGLNMQTPHQFTMSHLT